MLNIMLAVLAVQDVPAVPREAFIAAVDKRFATIDANGSGSLDTAELDAAQQRIVARIAEQRRNIATANFAAADADGDGAVTLSEWINAAAAAPISVWTGAQLLTSLDTDRNGIVSLDEYRASQLERFNERDTDGDGAVGAGER